MKIKKLPDQVINRIAAGEVVDRPFSVVRELVDNSLDAGATKITVSLDSGGRELIEVRDDGCGMSKEDALQAFERHATSKISVAEDLENLSTYGFRGEALAAISSVSKITLLTRTKNTKTGIEIRVEGGEIKTPRSIAASTGTTLQVRSLFFNTPARRKFLGSERGETMKCKQWLRAIALANPTVRFEFVVDQKQKLLLNSRKNATDRAQEIYGAGISFEESRGPVTLSGHLLHPAMAKSSAQALQILVNGRPVQDRMVLRAVKEGFGGALKGKEYPTGYVSIEIAPELVDVNIHPQKLEVRFWNSSEMYRLLYGLVKEAIQEFKQPASMESPRELPPLPPSPSKAGFTKSEPLPYQGSLARQVTPLEVPSPQEEIQVSHSRNFTYSSLRYLGMVLSCYLVCEDEDSLVIIDMHAAHERINYNKILTKLNADKVKQDQLLVPVSLTFDEEELVESLIEKKTLLEESGFSFRKVGSLQVEITGKPSWIPLGKVTEVLSEMAGSDLFQSSSIDKQREAVAARLSCHASIRSGDSIGREEVYALFQALDEAELSSACPHGRPVTLHFSKDEVEKLFGRIK